jgi:FAD/FMN-containing dehydrogenase
MNKYHGKSSVVVKPKSAEEVSKVMKYCYENDIAIVPQGGNTGLVGESRRETHVGVVNDTAKVARIRSTTSSSFRYPT